MANISIYDPRTMGKLVERIIVFHRTVKACTVGLMQQM